MEKGSERPERVSGFTLIELMVIMAILFTGACIVLPALANTHLQNRTVQCLNNHRQLAVAWRMYADDNSDKVIYNMGIPFMEPEINQQTYRNWANNILDWTTASMNTNRTLLDKGIMAPYLGTNSAAYKCPADNYLSPVQIAAGWSGRIRSVSMNSFFGLFSPGDASTASDKYWADPNYRQLLKTAQVVQPANTWVFIEEHPDSINDGFFANPPSASRWGDIPASHHDGALNLAFADSHVETHKWLSNTSRFPIKYVYGGFPPFDALGRVDFAWLRDRSGMVLYR